MNLLNQPNLPNRKASGSQLTFSMVAAICLLSMGCGGTEAGETTLTPTDTATVPDNDRFALVSETEGPVVNQNACSDGQWVDYECDARLGFLAGGCRPEFGSVIAYTPDDPCPICVPDESSVQSCGAGATAYRAFMQHVVTQSCANFCEEDADCFAWEISNACDTIVIPLFGAIDEEPILFAGIFASQHCAACPEVTDKSFSRRPGSDDFDAGARLLSSYRPTCDQNTHVCVLAPATEP